MAEQSRCKGLRGGEIGKMEKKQKGDVLGQKMVGAWCYKEAEGGARTWHMCWILAPFLAAYSILKLLGFAPLKSVTQFCIDPLGLLLCYLREGEKFPIASGKHNSSPNLCWIHCRNVRLFVLLQVRIVLTVL